MPTIDRELNKRCQEIGKFFGVYRKRRRKVHDYITLLALFDPLFKDRTIAGRVQHRIKRERNCYERDREWIERGERIIEHIKSYTIKPA